MGFGILLKLGLIKAGNTSRKISISSMNRLFPPSIRTRIPFRRKITPRTMKSASLRWFGLNVMAQFGFSRRQTLDGLETDHARIEGVAHRQAVGDLLNRRFAVVVRASRGTSLHFIVDRLFHGRIRLALRTGFRLKRKSRKSICMLAALKSCRPG